MAKVGTQKWFKKCRKAFPPRICKQVAASKKRRASFAGTATQHRHDASIFAHNSRKALQAFNRSLKSGNCYDAQHQLLVAHLRKGAYSASRDYTKKQGKGSSRAGMSMSRALIAAARRYYNGCVKRG